MKRQIPVKKCVYFWLISIVFGAVLSLDVIKTVAPANTDTGTDREREIEEWLNVLDAPSDRQDERNYKERDAEVTPWLKDAALPNPDNAALLYYQAFLLRPEPNMATSSQINEVLKGAEPGREIRIYLGRCLPMIQTAEVASQIPQCAWGIWYGTEAGFGVNSLQIETRNLVFILAVDARTLAADGHYRAALARCSTIRRLASHIGDETLLTYLTSRQIDSMALSTIQHVLGVMPPDSSTLAWLRGQLSVVQGVQPSIGKALQADFESILYSLRNNPGYIEKIRTVTMRKGKNKQRERTSRNLTDDELLVPTREAYSSFLNSLFLVMDSDIAYERKLTRVKQMISELAEKYDDEPATGYVISHCAGRLPEWYELQIEHHAHLNGIKAAVEIYLVVAKTGELPRELPNHLPQDPFTNRDFTYERTEDGFALRCGGQDILGRRKGLLEFKVRKQIGR